MTGIEGETLVVGMVLVAAAPWVLLATGKLKTPATTARKSGQTSAGYAPLPADQIAQRDAR